MQARAKAGEERIRALQGTLTSTQGRLEAAQKLLAALTEPDRAWLAELAACRQGLSSMGGDLALAAAMLVYGLARPAEGRAKLETAWKLQVGGRCCCSGFGVSALGHVPYRFQRQQ